MHCLLNKHGESYKTMTY
ncbi:hypothetical protein LINPERPRIM_LOCUS24765 [Linum perenne]